MKRLLIIALIAASAFGAYTYLKSELKTNLALNSAAASLSDAAEGALARAAGVFKGAGGAWIKLRDSISTPAGDSSGGAEVSAVRVVLKHGGVISGRLLKSSGGRLTVEWHGEPFVIEPGQIAKVDHLSQRDAEWPYSSDVVAVRTNGSVLDGRITEADPGGITVSFPQGGGSMDMRVKSSDIGRLLFAPVCNRESIDEEKRLRALYPKMKVYKEGDVTILTDSYDTWVRAYRKAVVEKRAEIYLKFFRLFGGRRALRQNFVVIFDNWEDYFKNMFADMGFVSPGIVGYFSPTDKALYVYNAWGDKTEKFYYGWVTGISGAYDRASDRLKAGIGDAGAGIMIDGLSKDLQDKYWDWYSIHKDIATDRTMSTLRHELTHEILHNRGLQNIIISRVKADKDAMARKKKDVLDAIELADKDKVERLFVELMKMKSREHEGLEVSAANSWLSEGMATYCETVPIGSVNEERLFSYQEAARKNAVNPIEFLTHFRMGSFSGLCSEAALDAYGESWALTSFLMAKYPDRFISYQIKLATNKPKDDEEDLRWLLESLGMDLPSLEREFREYMAAYPKIDDPDVKLFMRYQKVKDAFYDVWRRF
jgi:hypothetical protein